MLVMSNTIKPKVYLGWNSEAIQSCHWIIVKLSLWVLTVSNWLENIMIGSRKTCQKKTLADMMCRAIGYTSLAQSCTITPNWQSQRCLPWVTAVLFSVMRELTFATFTGSVFALVWFPPPEIAGDERFLPSVTSWTRLGPTVTAVFASGPRLRPGRKGGR